MNEHETRSREGLTNMNDGNRRLFANPGEGRGLSVSLDWADGCL